MNSKVLVVDDCRMTVLLLRYILAKEGIASDTAQSGSEALEKALHADYDLVFLDILLPGRSGTEVAAEIRRARGASAPEIVLLTALGEGFRPEMALEAGARGVLFKPVTPSQVVGAARSILQPAAG